MSRWPSAGCLWCLATAWFPLTAGHVYLLAPSSRNMEAHYAQKEWCPHCLSGEGLCPDDQQGSGVHTGKYEKPGEVQATYTSGQTAEFKIGVSAHHKGYYMFRLCVKSLSQACLNEHVLELAEDGNQKMDPKHPGRWYLPAPGAGVQIATATFKNKDAEKYVNNHKTNDLHIMYYKIPEGVTCERCTLQMDYTVGNGKIENFKNCADIKITGGSGNKAASQTQQSPAPMVKKLKEDPILEAKVVKPVQGAPSAGAEQGPKTTLEQESSSSAEPQKKTTMGAGQGPKPEPEPESSSSAETQKKQSTAVRVQGPSSASGRSSKSCFGGYRCSCAEKANEKKCKPMDKTSWCGKSETQCKSCAGKWC